jgi:hypothetical protein
VKRKILRDSKIEGKRPFAYKGRLLGGFFIYEKEEKETTKMATKLLRRQD